MLLVPYIAKVLNVCVPTFMIINGDRRELCEGRGVGLPAPEIYMPDYKRKLTDQISVGRAGPLLKFDAAARQVLPKLHPPLRWQVLHGVLLSHVRVTDPKGEGVGQQGKGGRTRGLTAAAP